MYLYMCPLNLYIYMCPLKSVISVNDVDYGQVRVWDLETLKCKHALKQPGGGIRALVTMHGDVWGGVGAELVVWGRSGCK